MRTPSVIHIRFVSAKKALERRWTIIICMYVWVLISAPLRSLAVCDITPVFSDYFGLLLRFTVYLGLLLGLPRGYQLLYLCM